MVLLRTCLALCVATLLGTYASSSESLETSNSSDSTTEYVQSESDIQSELDAMQLVYYERSPTGNVSYNYSIKTPEEIMKHVDLTKPYVLYVHGFGENLGFESVRKTVSSYLQRGTDNLLVADWSFFASNAYVIVSARTGLIAKMLAEGITKLVANGLDPEKLHVIGASFGGQIVGFIGRYLDFTIPRVTGLDPSNPLEALWGTEHLDETSGRQVDILFTDSGLLGMYWMAGTINFYANSGSGPQPGCDGHGESRTDQSLCSHRRAYHFYAESVVNETAFPAIECDSYSAFVHGDCEGNRIVYSGYATPPNATGMYFFNTNDESPFGKGLEGIHPTMSN